MLPLKKTILAWPTERDNKYLSILYSSLGERKYSILPFKSNWFAPFISNKIHYFHFHWLNAVLSGHLVSAAFKSICFVFYLVFLKLTNTETVWTLHNSNPYTHSQKHKVLERSLAGIVMHLVDRVVIHSKYQIEHISSNHRHKATHIPHHSYSRPKLSHATEKRSGILFFGSLQDYKGADFILDLASNIEQLGEHLSIYGKVPTRYFDNFRNLPNNPIKSGMVHIENRFVSDIEIFKKTNESKGVILPYKAITNSGTLVHALSYKSRIFMKRSKLSKEMIDLYKLDSVILEFDNIPELISLIRSCDNSPPDPRLFEYFINCTDIDKVTIRYQNEIFE